MISKKKETKISFEKVKAKNATSPSPSASAKDPNFVVHYPSEDDWKNLVKILGLNKDSHAKHELWEFIGDMVADVLNFQKMQKAKIDRREGIRRIKNLDVRISNLKNALKTESKNLTEIIPLTSLEELGKLFTVGAASIAAQKRRFPEDPLPTSSGKDGIPEIYTLEDVENFYVGLRRNNGLLYGTELLQLALETIHKPIKEWLTKNSDNPGGRPKKSLRDVMIQRTIIYGEKILKITPKTKKGGPFMTFCNICLVSCGVPEEGLDKALAAAINEHAKRMKTTSKPSYASRKSKS